MVPFAGILGNLNKFQPQGLLRSGEAAVGWISEAKGGVHALARDADLEFYKVVPASGATAFVNDSFLETLVDIGLDFVPVVGTLKLFFGIPAACK
jgi:hypothetical protein